MSLGLVATVIEALDPWETACGLMVAGHPTLAYVILPREGDVDSLAKDGPKHILEKFSLEQARMYVSK